MVIAIWRLLTPQRGCTYQCRDILLWRGPVRALILVVRRRIGTVG